MDPGRDPPPPPEERARQRQITMGVRDVATRYGWHLLLEPELAGRVAARLPRAAVPDLALVERLCKEEAGAALLEACERGEMRFATAGERQRMEIAYADLRGYLATIAPHLVLPGPALDADDLVQEALIAIRQSHTGCREPRAFLAWAATILRRARVDAWREVPRTGSLEALEEVVATGARGLRSLTPAGPDRHVDPSGDQDVLAVLRVCLDTEEERWLAITAILGVKRRELGLALTTPLARLDRVRLAVKAKLARCAEFQALLRAV